MCRSLGRLVQGVALTVVLTFVLMGIPMGASLGLVTSAQAREAAPFSSDRVSVALAELPVEGRLTYERIHRGGPFPYPAKDGVIFGNRERLLPRETRGYYREYTVPTPQLNHRGARRIVCGGNQPKSPEVCYYTQDHYASFRRIAN